MMNRSWRIVVICLVLAAHGAVDLWLLVGAWDIGGGAGVFLLPCPFSQGSLIAIWAALSQRRSYVRFPVALAALAWVWFVTLGTLEGYDMTGPESAGWAAMFATQALIILIFTTLGYVVSQRIRRRRAGGIGEAAQPVQFSIRFLLLWTALLAATLGSGQTVVAQLGWTAEVVKWEYFYLCQVLGGCNAVFALIVLASLVGRAWMVRRVLLATTLIGVLGYGQWHLFVFLFGDADGIKEKEFLMMASLQAASLYATLLPLRLCGCFGLATGGKGPQQPGSPFAQVETPTPRP